MLRDDINHALRDAQKIQDKTRRSTLRLINAAIQDRDIAARSADREGVGNDVIIEILSKMVKQREEAAITYEEAGRLEIAEQERAEIEIIREFLPPQLDDAEIKQIITQACETLKAQSLKDMGRLMAHLKENYAGQMDFARAAAVIKEQLS